MGRFLTPFFMLCLVGFSARLGYQMARAPVLPRFAQEAGAESWLIGLIVGASTITGVLVKLPAGALSDVLGRRRMLLLGSAFFAFPPFLYLFVEDPYSLLGLRFLHGFATAIFSPVAAATVADLFQQGRGEKLGWFASSYDMGAAFGPLIGGAVLAALAGPGLAKFHVTMLIVGGLGVLTFLLALLLPIGQEIPPNPPLAKGGLRGFQPPPTADRPQPVGVQGEISAVPKAGRWKQFQQGIGEVLSNRPILIASSVEAAMFLGVGALLGFLPLYARNIVHLNDAYVAVLIWVPLVMAMAGKPVAGRISDRIGRRPVILVGLALCIAMLPLVPLTTSLVLLLVEGAVFGLGMAIVTPSATALVADLCKAGNYGAAMGVFGTIWDVGEAAGPILAGVIIFTLGTLETSSAYLVAFAAIAGAMALVGLIFGITVREPELA